jgi:hypothetical protein
LSAGRGGAPGGFVGGGRHCVEFVLVGLVVSLFGQVEVFSWVIFSTK